MHVSRDVDGVLAVTDNLRSQPLRVAVGISSVGRPEVLKEMLVHLAGQRRPPDRVVVSVVEEADVVGVLPVPVAAEIVFGPKGSSAQRNTILRTLDDCDAVVFFDDDFFAAPDYIDIVEGIFQRNEDVVVVTGAVVADGILGPGISVQSARAILERDPGASDRYQLQPGGYGYGCNLAVRLSAVRADGVEFDENLPLYAWLEDVDFVSRLGRHGRVVKAVGARGVHLGVKLARSPGRRLGYSQVANPLYLYRKGSVPLSFAVTMISRNFAKNLIRSLFPEPYVDRSGRLRGNLLAALDLLRNRADPRRILDL